MQPWVFLVPQCSNFPCLTELEILWAFIRNVNFSTNCFGPILWSHFNQRETEKLHGLWYRPLTASILQEAQRPHRASRGTVRKRNLILKVIEVDFCATKSFPITHLPTEITGDAICPCDGVRVSPRKPGWDGTCSQPPGTETWSCNFIQLGKPWMGSPGPGRQLHQVTRVPPLPSPSSCRWLFGFYVKTPAFTCF